MNIKTIIFCLISLNLFAQDPWEIQIPTEPNLLEEFTACDKSDDGFLYAGGLSTNTSQLNDFYLVKMDASTGAMIWEKKYQDGFAEIRDIEIVSDGIIAVGVQFDNASDFRNALMVKFDFDGNVMWTKKEESLYGASFDHIASLNDTQIIIGGFQVPDWDDAQSKVLLVKMDINGENRTALHDNLNDQGYRLCRSINLTSNGQVFINLAKGNDNHGLVIDEFDGTTKFELEYLEDFRYVKEITFDNGDYFALMGESAQAEESAVVKYSDTGTLLESFELSAFLEKILGFEVQTNSLQVDWYRNFPNSEVISSSLGKNTLNELSSLNYPISDSLNLNSTNSYQDGEDLYFVGSQSNNFQLDARSYKFDDQFNLVWDKSFGEFSPSTTELTSEILQARDEGYVFNYTKSIDGFKNNIIGKISNAGNILWETQIPTPERQTHFGRLFQASDGAFYYLYYMISDSKLCKLGEDGTLLWDITIPNISLRKFRGGISELPNGNIAVTFPSIDNNIRPSALTIFNLNGDLVKENFIGIDFETYETKEMLTTSDGNLVVCGYARTQNSSSLATVAKYDSDGLFDLGGNFTRYIKWFRHFNL